MERTFRRQLAAIQQDRRSGASELALRACAALRSWLDRRSKPTEQEVFDVAHSILHAQPFMAPLIRLANELLLAAESDRTPQALARTVSRFRRLLQQAPGKIARQFIRRLRRHSPRAVATYSYSSTVIRCLSQSRAYLPGVLCSESRPGYEGRATARALAGTKIPVLFLTDAGLSARIEEAWMFITGADAVLSGGFINKVGTRMLASRALEAGRMTPEAVGKELEKIRVSARLLAMAD